MRHSNDDIAHRLIIPEVRSRLRRRPPGGRAVDAELVVRSAVRRVELDLGHDHVVRRVPELDVALDAGPRVLAAAAAEAVAAAGANSLVVELVGLNFMVLVGCVGILLSVLGIQTHGMLGTGLNGCLWRETYIRPHNCRTFPIRAGSCGSPAPGRWCS